MAEPLVLMLVVEMADLTDASMVYLKVAEKDE